MALLSRSLEKLTPVQEAISEAGGNAISIPCNAGMHRAVLAAD